MDRFLQFTNSFKTLENQLLIECIQEAYNTCFENYGDVPNDRIMIFSSEHDATSLNAMSHLIRQFSSQIVEYIKTGVLDEDIEDLVNIRVFEDNGKVKADLTWK
jgi:hypothetical protein